MQPQIPIAQVPVRVEKWLNETREVAAMLAQLGGGTIPRGDVKPSTTPARNGGTTATIRALVTTAVMETPGIKFPDLAEYVAANNPAISKAVLANTLKRLRDTHVFKTKGKKGGLQYFLPAS